MGLARAKLCSHPGIVLRGTKTELANTSGKIHTKLADWAVSTSRSTRPMVAEIHDMAKPNPRATPSATRAGSTPMWMRKPMSVPTRTMRTTTARLRTVSEMVRPASTAERAMGRERKRSMIPLVMSSARPTPVWVEPNTTVWTTIPGIRKSM